MDVATQALQETGSLGIPDSDGILLSYYRLTQPEPEEINFTNLAVDVAVYQTNLAHYDMLLKVGESR